MESRKLFLILGAVVSAIVCAVMIRSMWGGQPAPEAAAAGPAQPAGPEVLVATRPLAAGTIVTPDAFRYQPWPTELVEKAYYLKGDATGQNLNGTVVRFPITAGQPITQGAIVKPGDRGFLAAALSPGMRAVTISVSTQSGVAGFVFPGDRVDLLLSQTVSGTEGQPLRATETIARNIRVLATDQRTDKTVDDAGKTVVSAFSNVTIETTPKLSEKIAVAQQLGALSLSLRPIADDRMELERQIAAGEIEVPANGDKKAEKQMLLQVAAHPVDDEGSVTTGGEVSRFARRSMPSQAPSAPPMGSAPPVLVPATPRPRGPMITIVRGQAMSQVAAGGGN